MRHEFNEVLDTEFPFASTELQSPGYITCLTRHQNTVTAITICVNDVVTRDAPPTTPHRTVHIYMHSFKRDSALMGKINKQLIYQINHDELIDCKFRGKSICSP